MKKYIFIILGLAIVLILLDGLKTYTFNFKAIDIKSIQVIDSDSKFIESSEFESFYKDMQALKHKFYYGKIKNESAIKIIIILKDNTEYKIESGRLVIKNKPINFKTDEKTLKNLIKKY